MLFVFRHGTHNFPRQRSDIAFAFQRIHFAFVVALAFGSMAIEAKFLIYRATGMGFQVRQSKSRSRHYSECSGNET